LNRRQMQCSISFNATRRGRFQHMKRGSAFPRNNVPGFCEASPRKDGGRREGRVFCAPAAARAVQKAHALVTTGPPNIPAFPARLVLPVYPRALPGVRPVSGLLSHRRLAKRLASLDPSVERSGPRAFAVRDCCARLAPLSRPSLPAASVRGVRDTPFLWRGMGGRMQKLLVSRSETLLGVETAGEISFSTHAILPAKTSARSAPCRQIGKN
jgi:hypothetical protein